MSRATGKWRIRFDYCSNNNKCTMDIDYKRKVTLLITYKTWNIPTMFNICSILACSTISKLLTDFSLHTHNMELSGDLQRSMESIWMKQSPCFCFVPYMCSTYAESYLSSLYLHIATRMYIYASKNFTYPYIIGPFEPKGYTYFDIFLSTCFFLLFLFHIRLRSNTSLIWEIHHWRHIKHINSERFT